MSAAPRWPTAFLSGAASGIGLRLAELLGRRGTAIAVFDQRIGEDARRLLEGLSGARLSLHEVDVRDGEALAEAVGAAASGLGPPALAVNCAGVQRSRAFAELSEEEFRRVVEVNLVGSRNFAAAVLPRMAAGSQLALVASLAGVVPNYGYAAYSASKFGVVGLAGVLRLECRPRGIAVAAICPPEVETPMATEEWRSGNPVGLELKRFAGTLGVERAADEIVRGLEARRPLIIPGHRGRLSWRLARFAPRLTNAISDRMVERALRRHGG